MKIANISVAKQVPASYFLIKNVDDLLEYQEFLNKEMEISMVRVMRSEVRPERWNHILRSDSHGDSVLMHSYLKCHIQGGSPLLTATFYFNKKLMLLKNIYLTEKLLLSIKREVIVFLITTHKFFPLMNISLFLKIFTISEKTLKSLILKMTLHLKNALWLISKSKMIPTLHTFLI